MSWASVWWDKVRKPIEEIVAQAAQEVVSELLRTQLISAAKYVERKRGKFRDAIIKRWKEKGIETADRAAADASLDAVVDQIL